MRPDLSELWLPLFLVPVCAGAIILSVFLIDPKPRNEVCRKVISDNENLYVVQNDIDCPDVVE